MASLLSVKEVEYECSCGEWESVNRLYFCRHCSQVRCAFCVSQEVDSTFCPSCLDNVSTSEARLKKNRCPNCYQCPICGVGVVVRAVSDAYHLSCNTCRWTTMDSGVPDVPANTAWPEYDHRDEVVLNGLVERFRQQASIERSDREKHKYTKRRSNLGMLSDRFGLQRINDRRKAGSWVDKSSSMLPNLPEPTDQLPELPESIFTEQHIDEGTVPSLMQMLKQPLAAGRPLLPLKAHLVARRAVRCKQCDHSLCKGEYSPNSVKFKIQVLAGTYLPVVRLSRCASLIAGQWCPVFLTVSNFSACVTRVIVVTDDSESGDQFVKCETQAVELIIPNRDETAEAEESIEREISGTSGAIVFRRGHQVGLRVSVQATEGVRKQLALIVKHSNSSSSFEASGDHPWLQHKVRISLGDAPPCVLTK